MVWTKTFEINELKEKEKKLFKYNDLEIVIYKDKNYIYAFENRCSHEDYPLLDGFIEGEEVECAKHGARFNIKTGDVLSMPAAVPIKVYKTKIENNIIYLDIPQ